MHSTPITWLIFSLFDGRCLRCDQYCSVCGPAFPRKSLDTLFMVYATPEIQHALHFNAVLVYLVLLAQLFRSSHPIKDFFFLLFLPYFLILTLMFSFSILAT